MGEEERSRLPGAKIAWRGTIISVQPRIRLTRSFDQRHHTYLGYVLHVLGVICAEEREFSIAIGEAAQAKHGFRVGDGVRGEGVPVGDPRTETAEPYKVSGLRIVARGGSHSAAPPPWHTLAIPLREYRARGHRRLDARAYESSCASCVWGCRMSVEMIVDHWNPSVKRYRLETFCYGPKSCALYKGGPTRKVPGRRGTSWEEAGWVDEEAVAHREPDE